MINEASPVTVFRKFDEYMSEAGRRQVSTPEEAAKVLAKAIDLLPQRSAIKDEDIPVWLDRTFSMAMRRPGVNGVQDAYDHVLWHVRRASGIGGSESGAMLAFYSKEGQTFQGAHGIIQQKLLQAAPQPSTRDMRRGVRAEEHIQRIFLEQYGAVSRTDLVDKTRGFRPEVTPWIIGTPDDIIDYDGLTLINDYKAPSAEVYDKLSDGVSFEYRAQLHHYAIVTASAKIQFHGLALTPFSYKDFEVGFFDVKWDVPFAKRLRLAASRMWQEHVMTGNLPEIKEVPNITPSDPEVRHLVYKAASLKEIAREVDARIVEAQNQLAGYFNHNSGLATGKAAFLVADFTRARTYDEEILTGLAEAHGIEKNDFYTASNKVIAKDAIAIVEKLHSSLTDISAINAVLKDLKKSGVPKVKTFEADLLADALVEIGVDVTPAMLVETKFSLTRKKKGPEAEQLSQVKDLAVELVDALDETHDMDLRQMLHTISIVGEQPENGPDQGEELNDAVLEDVMGMEL